MSDCAPENKSAVRLLYGKSDDSYWFPCCVHFFQFAMKEAVASYFSCTVCNTDCTEEFTFDELRDKKITSRLESTQRKLPFERLTTICRSIRATIRRSHESAQRFRDLQIMCGVFKGIKSDVPTRSDSTLELFSTVFQNKEVLRHLQNSALEG